MESTLSHQNHVKFHRTGSKIHRTATLAHYISLANSTAAWQNTQRRTTTAVGQRSVCWNSVGPWHSGGQPIEYVCSRVCCQSFLFISVALSQDCQTFPLYGCCEDAGKCVRLDYCNSLLAGAASGLLTKLQFVQNAAARFVTRSRKFDRITPVLRDLHWLSVRMRITFKVATLVYTYISYIYTRLTLVLTET